MAQPLAGGGAPRAVLGEFGRRRRVGYRGEGAGDEDGVKGEGAGIGYGGRLTMTRGSLRAGGRMHPNEHCGAFPGGPEPRPGRERRRDGPGACRSDRRDGQLLAGNVSFRVPTPVRRRTAMSEFVSHVWK